MPRGCIVAVRVWTHAGLLHSAGSGIAATECQHGGGTLKISFGYHWATVAECVDYVSFARPYLLSRRHVFGRKRAAEGFFGLLTDYRSGGYLC